MPSHNSSPRDDESRDPNVTTLPGTEPGTKPAHLDVGPPGERVDDEVGAGDTKATKRQE